MRSRRRLAALALAPLAALVALDLALSALSLRPPDDPLAFFLRTHEARIDPFVAAGDGALEIRPDWVNDGLGLRGRRGLRAGRQFLLPGFRPVRIPERKPPGTLRVFVLGESTAYALYYLQERGAMMIDPQTRVYEGMIVGQHSRDNDLIVNVIQGKKLTNVRAAGKDDALILTPPMRMSLEEIFMQLTTEETAAPPRGEAVAPPPAAPSSTEEALHG